MDSERPSIASFIDHTNLSPDASREDIGALCREAVEFQFAAVCVNPGRVRQAARLLQGTGVHVATVIGFPLGATTMATKAFEAGEAVQNGADELDLVLNIAALKEGACRAIGNEITRVRQCAVGKTLKVILETALLTNEEKRLAAKLAGENGADMVKTSTGFFGGVTVDDVLLLKETVPDLGIKASGGIRDATFALELITAGATRLGTSSAVKIMRELLQ
jgi:deoxyribose-phosphate aldolase